MTQFTNEILERLRDNASSTELDIIYEGITQIKNGSKTRDTRRRLRELVVTGQLVEIVCPHCHGKGQHDSGQGPFFSSKCEHCDGGKAYAVPYSKLEDPDIELLRYSGFEWVLI